MKRTIYIINGEKYSLTRKEYLHIKLYNEGLTEQEYKEYKELTK